MMGIGDHGILAVGKDRMEVAKETVAQMVDDESEVISIYYGADTEEAEAEELATALEEAYPDCDVELQMGGQPIYYYVISVEQDNRVFERDKRIVHVMKTGIGHC